jgi:hypothetical protein
LLFGRTSIEQNIQLEYLPLDKPNRLYQKADITLIEVSEFKTSGGGFQSRFRSTIRLRANRK